MCSQMLGAEFMPGLEHWVSRIRRLPWSAQQVFGAASLVLTSPSLESLMLSCAEALPSTCPASFPRMSALTTNCESIHRGFFEGLPLLANVTIGGRCKVSRSLLQLSPGPGVAGPLGLNTVHAHCTAGRCSQPCIAGRPQLAALHPDSRIQHRAPCCCARGVCGAAPARGPGPQH